MLQKDKDMSILALFFSEDEKYLKYISELTT